MFALRELAPIQICLKNKNQCLRHRTLKIMNTDLPALSESPKLSAEQKIDSVRRRNYLVGKGIKSESSQQLDLLFPETIGFRSDLRHIPNDYARSSLFTVRNHKEVRKTLVRQKLFHYNEHISILYTGIELRAADDEVIWLQILNYGQKVPLGEPFEFLIKNIVAEVGWTKSGRNYERARECISRLRANEVLALNSKAYGSSGSVSLIKDYIAVNDSEGKTERFRVWIDPNLLTLFAGNTFTSHTWEIYRELSPVARRMADYVESHKNPYPLDLAKFQKMCGSTTIASSSWRQTVKKACDELINCGIVKAVRLNKLGHLSFI